MRELIFVMALLGSSVRASDNKKVETLKILNTVVQVTDVDYDTKDRAVVSDFTLVQPTVFTLAEGNKFLATDLVYVDQHQRIRLAVVNDDQVLDWKLSRNRKIRLDCGRHMATFQSPTMGRAVAFWPGDRYRKGCDLLEPETFALGDQTIAVTGGLELSEHGEIRYARKVLGGKIRLGKKVLDLSPDSELSLFDSGKISFFTPAHGSTFAIRHPQYGDLEFKQREDRDVAMTFLENGLIEQGILAQDFRHPETGVVIPASSDVSFDKTGELKEVRMSWSTQVNTLQTTFSASRMAWDPKSHSALYLTDADFEFRDDQTMDVYKVPAGSTIRVDASRKIIGVVPDGGGKGFRKTQEI